MFKRNVLIIICFVLSAVLLTVIQPPFNLSFFAWFALVPFVAGSLVNEKTWPTVLFAYLISLAYWLGNLYWMILVTVPGGIAFCIYMALYWPILAVCLRYCVQRKVPLWFSLPILIVGAEAFQGLCFRGFGWRYLGHSQYANISIIQIADIFGAAGVSFLVAMVNGAVCDIIFDFKNGLLKKATVIGGLITIAVLALTIFYGRYRINQSADFLEEGPKIGIVQPNVPVVAAKDTEPGETIFLRMFNDTRDCMLAGSPLLIVWPETMIESVLSDSYLKYASGDDTAKIFHDALLRLSSRGVNILVGSFAGDLEKVDDKLVLKTSYNAAFLYEPNQVESRQCYCKIHLVPFGEYIPFKNILPVLNRFLIALTPYDYDYTVDAGTEYTVFKINSDKKIYRFGVMICYEDTVPKIARKLTYDKNKQVDWLVNISNDGWFVSEKNGKFRTTTELAQHTAICVFRAVENRVPVIRSVNTGISCFIDSLGRIRNGYLSGNIEKNAFDRTAQAGWLVDRISIDKRVTFFSQTGQNIEIACGVCFIFAAFVSIYKNTRLNLKKKVVNDNET